VFSQYIQAIEGVAAYPIVALVVFVPFFIGVVVAVLRMRREHADRMSRLPLQ
jgi:hypothetical protein